MVVHCRKDKGFTLTELLIVIAIIGILAAIAVPSYMGQQRSATRNEAYTNLQNLRLAEEQFMAERARYSPCAGPAYASPAPGVTVVLGTAGKDHDNNNVIRTGNADANNALPGFQPGPGQSFSYWIVNGQSFPINTAANPPTGTNLAAGAAPCFVAFAQGNTGTRVDGETFAIDCNNNRNF